MKRTLLGLTLLDWAWLLWLAVWLFGVGITWRLMYLGEWPQATFSLVLALWLWDKSPRAPDEEEFEDPYRPMATRWVVCTVCGNLHPYGAVCSTYTNTRSRL